MSAPRRTWVRFPTPRQRRTARYACARCRFIQRCELIFRAVAKRSAADAIISTPREGRSCVRVLSAESRSRGQTRWTGKYVYWRSYAREQRAMIELRCVLLEGLIAEGSLDFHWIRPSALTSIVNPLILAVQMLSSGSEASSQGARWASNRTRKKRTNIGRKLQKAAT